MQRNGTWEMYTGAATMENNSTLVDVLLVEMYVDAATMESSMEVPQNIKNRTT